MLLETLERLGRVVAEPARTLIHEHREETGEPTLDHRPALLVERLVARSVRDSGIARGPHVWFYDRGIPDCIAYAEVIAVDPPHARAAAHGYRYADPVFVCPPWREIYATDELRRATFEQVERFHDRLIAACQSLGYRLVEIPGAPVPERSEFLRSALALDRSQAAIGSVSPQESRVGTP